MIFLAFFQLFTARVRSRPPGPPAVPGVYLITFILLINQTSANTTKEEIRQWSQRLQVFAPHLWPPPPPSKLVSSWSNTTSLVIVRHPMARLASVYYQKLMNLAVHQTWAPKIKLMIHYFRDDPKSGDQVHPTPQEMVR